MKTVYLFALVAALVLVTLVLFATAPISTAVRECLRDTAGTLDACVLDE